MSSTQYTLPGMHITDHVVTVPLDWNNPDDARSITVFAREVVDPRKRNDQLPVLVFLQGGPGGKSPRPMPGEGWIAAVLETHRVVLVDQRGTGRSTRVQSGTLAQFGSTGDARDYLLCFRADSIVADLEYIRTRLYNGVKWESLGQSYGGFITLSYLSLAPEGLSACYVAGGLTSVMPSADEVYRRTYPRVAEKTRRFYERYPLERERVGAVADLVAEGDVVLPDGDLLTVRRLQTLGLDLGMAPGFDRVHWLFDDAFADEPRREGTLSDSFLAQVAAKTSYDDNPLFAVMQESIYGSGAGATRWAADRIGQRHLEFSTDERPLLFTGEMMYPWMFDQIRSLRPFKAVAEALAEFEDYTVLYDLDRLVANEVPVASVSYFDDMYVDVGFSTETKDLVGNLHFWVTNEYEHDGIRQDVKVTQRLISLVSERGGPLS